MGRFAARFSASEIGTGNERNPGGAATVADDDVMAIPYGVP